MTSFKVLAGRSEKVGRSPSLRSTTLDDADLLEQVQGLGADESSTRMLSATLDPTAHLRRFLDEARRDAPSLSSRFRATSPVTSASRSRRSGNGARVVDIGARSLWLDSHSDKTASSASASRHLRGPGDVPRLAPVRAKRLGPPDRATTVAVFSEFGRFPRLNGESGKDHWPENSWILVGKGVRRGVTIGGTDAVGKGLPIDYRTGEPRHREGRPLFIDNTFATLLRIAGDDPEDTRYERDAPVEAILSTVS